MVTTKPSDNDRPSGRPRTGHGAASVIPLLHQVIPRSSHQADDDSAADSPRPDAPDPTGTDEAES